MKRNVIKIIVVSIFLLFTLTGCYREEDKILAKQYQKQAKINAINYLKEKYGFEEVNVLSVKEVAISNDLSIFSKPSSELIYVVVEANGKTFEVQISGGRETTDGIDTYQYDDMEKDIINYFKSNIPFELYDYSLEFHDGGINEYYNDLSQAFSALYTLNLYYVGENDLNLIDLEKLSQFTKEKSVGILNFESKEKCEEYKKAELKNIALSNDNIKNIYIDSYIKLFKDKIEVYHNNITNYNDELYLYSPNEPFDYEITISEFNDFEAIIDIAEKEHPGIKGKKIEFITPVYSVPINTYTYLYFPKDKLELRSSNNLFLAIEVDDDEKTHFLESYFGLDSKIKFGTVGDYYFESIGSYEGHTTRFALIRVK